MSTHSALNFLMSVSVAASAVEGATIRVPTDQPTIQAGINAATNGDTVFVSPGIYVENINLMGKAITLLSVSGPEVTVIDGNNTGTVVTINSGELTNCVLNGFTIRNGLANFGGGIYVNLSTPTIINNIISSNQAVYGYGISVLNASPIIQSNVIMGNQNNPCCTGGGGGGIDVTASGANASRILDNVIISNAVVAGHGGGIRINTRGVLIQGNVIRGNSVTGLIPAARGGGLWMYSTCTVIQNLIVENEADQGSGVYWNAARQTLINNTIANNHARQGIASCVYGDVVSPDVVLVNNILASPAGQTAFHCDDSFGDPTLLFNDIFSASGPAWGGSCSNQIGVNGNISTDPSFVNVPARDYHLQLSSPCVDTGDNTATNLPSTDFEGVARILDGNGDGIAVVDMGAFEVQAGQPEVICALTPSLATNAVGMAHTVTATITTNTSPVAGVSVDFTVVDGPNLGQSGSTNTDVNGQAGFTYAGSGTNGTDIIQAAGVVSGVGFTCTATKVWIAYPPGDVNGSFTVTGADSLLINQVLVGLRSNTHPVFAAAGFVNGDVNTNNAINGADSLLINQVIVGLRAYATTKILPGSHASNQTTAVTIFGVGFPTNVVPTVNIGAPVNLTLTNVIVLSREKITATVPPGGGLGTGTVNVVSSPTNGVISFGRFINE